MRRTVAVLLVLAGSLALTGCELVEGIFRVGLWAGVILVLVVLLVIWLIVRMIR
jgi:hypothetical protein